MAIHVPDSISLPVLVHPYSLKCAFYVDVKSVSSQNLNIFLLRFAQSLTMLETYISDELWVKNVLKTELIYMFLKNISKHRDTFGVALDMGFYINKSLIVVRKFQKR